MINPLHNSFHITATQRKNSILCLCLDHCYNSVHCYQEQHSFIFLLPLKFTPFLNKGKPILPNKDKRREVDLDRNSFKSLPHCFHCFPCSVVF